MRESGEALVESLGITTGSRCWISAAATERRRCRRRSSAPTCSASTSPATSSRPATGAPRPRASPTAGSRKATPATCSRLADDSFDLVVSVFGAMFAPKPFDVAKEMVRVTRPGGRIVMGNWIPNDPTLGRPDPEDQLGLFAAAARRLHQPDDLGRGEQRDRAIRRPRAFPRRRSRSCATPSRFNFAGTPGGVRRRCSGRTTARP